MGYTPTTWKNGASPAINAPNLNKIENGIWEAHRDMLLLKVPFEKANSNLLRIESALVNPNTPSTLTRTATLNFGNPAIPLDCYVRVVSITVRAEREYNDNSLHGSARAGITINGSTTWTDYTNNIGGGGTYPQYHEVTKIVNVMSSSVNPNITLSVEGLPYGTSKTGFRTSGYATIELYLSTRLT